MPPRRDMLAALNVAVSEMSIDWNPDHPSMEILAAIRKALDKVNHEP